MYDTFITLKGNPVVTYDAYGNESVEYTDHKVFAVPRSVYSSEFYSARQLGLNPSITFVLTNRADYNGEKLLEHDGKLYTIIRTNWKDFRDRIELICEERIGVKDYGEVQQQGTGSS